MSSSIKSLFTDRSEMKDFDGSPLLVLTQGEADRLLDAIDNPLDYIQDKLWFAIYNKIREVANGDV